MSDLADRLDRAHGRLRATAPPVTEEDRPFFTPKGLAAYLELSERTVRQLIADRTIASYKIAGVRRIHRRDVDNFLAQRRQS